MPLRAFVCPIKSGPRQRPGPPTRCRPRHSACYEGLAAREFPLLGPHLPHVGGWLASFGYDVLAAPGTSPLCGRTESAARSTPLRAADSVRLVSLQRTIESEYGASPHSTPNSGAWPENRESGRPVGAFRR